MSPVISPPKIGVTLGDPTGIGPEIVARALIALPKEQQARILVFGDKRLLSEALDSLGGDPSLSLSAHCDHPLSVAEVKPGHPNRATGAAQIAYLEESMLAVAAGRIAGLATAPISKASAQDAGFAFPGHTEFLAERLAAKEVAMMFAGPALKVVLATVHVAVAELPKVLTQSRILSAIRLAAHALRRDFGIATPRIGVLGLNPHAGEGGRFGREESTLIEPAIALARNELEGLATVEGPLVPDAAFRMPYDCFVAMYHDQGLIPVKLVDFDESVNTTLGLPIVRTSPDHGVAYDIAGKGIARATSMSAAIALALRLVDVRARPAG